MEEASRKKPVSAEFKELLEIVNSLEKSSWDIQHFAIEIMDLIRERDSPGARLPWPDRFSKFKDFIEKRFPEDKYPRFRQFLGPLDKERIAISTDRWGGLWDRCLHLVDARELLREIVLLNEDGIPWSGISVRFNDKLRTELNERGEINFRTHPLQVSLQGVEAARIRHCPICGNFFWAGRLDQRCCSVPCAKRWRTRQWRAKYEDPTDGYKLRRNDNEPKSTLKTSKQKKEKRQGKARSG